MVNKTVELDYMTDKDIEDKLRAIQADYIARQAEIKATIDKIGNRFDSSLDKLDRVINTMGDKNEIARDKLRADVDSKLSLIEEKIQGRNGKTVQYTALVISMASALIAVINGILQHIHFT